MTHTRQGIPRSYVSIAVIDFNGRHICLHDTDLERERAVPGLVAEDSQSHPAGGE